MSDQTRGLSIRPPIGGQVYVAGAGDFLLPPEFNRNWITIEAPTGAAVAFGKHDDPTPVVSLTPTVSTTDGTSGIINPSPNAGGPVPGDQQRHYDLKQIGSAMGYAPTGDECIRMTVAGGPVKFWRS